ncbi:MAG TPA: efflux RND transporter permease subunit [Mariniphaga sp.]|nr:efflux RND transporter permease subunit [Mariniphaga sp.]
MTGIIAIIFGLTWGGVMLILFGLAGILQYYYKPSKEESKKWVDRFIKNLGLIIAGAGVIWLLGNYWMPLGAGESLFLNIIFVGFLVGLILIIFNALEYFYPSILRWCLNHKTQFLAIPSFLILVGLMIWLGFNTLFGFVAKGFDNFNVNIRTTGVWSSLTHTFPGVGEEFMPTLDEGSFLLMPTSMPHSGMEYNRKVLAQLDMLVTGIPEVDLTVGKMGRAETALDPAPVSMFENVINYKPEYILDDRGRRIRFKTTRDGRFLLQNGDTLTNEEALHNNISEHDLLPDNNGSYFRNWRSSIQSPDDIWDEIVRATRIPGVTSAPRLQPIETRLVMLQTGMRAPMGIKVYGPDLSTIEEFGLKLEDILKGVPSVKRDAVFAERIVGKPYLHININRDEIARYGLSIEDVQHLIETAIGGMSQTSTVEGRQRFPVRVRYPRELRDDPDKIADIIIPTPTGAQVPLGQLVNFEYIKGPQMIRSEETFLVGYVLFDKNEGFAEVTVVNDAQDAIQEAINSGSLTVPAGVSFKFSGNYENQIRAEKRLALVIPLVLIIIFLILYFQFKSVATTLMIFSGVAMAFSGGFIMLWLYGQEGFANFTLFGTNMRDLFQMGTVNLSVAVWVGFIALFGLATDDGVLMGTYLDQSFARRNTDTVKGIRAAVIEAGKRRIKPAIMTSATTIIALLPILTSTGRGSDIMIPMAIPAFGGMLVAAITYFIVPTLYSLREEQKIKSNQP